MECTVSNKYRIARMVLACVLDTVGGLRWPGQCQEHEAE
jgi:hypothetical protein